MSKSFQSMNSNVKFVHSINEKLSISKDIFIRSTNAQSKRISYRFPYNFVPIDDTYA